MEPKLWDIYDRPLDELQSEILTIQEVAKVLKVSPPTVRKYILECGLPAARLGGTWRILKVDLLRWLEKNRREHPVEWLR